jgi:hypothetical protein
MCTGLDEVKSEEENTFYNTGGSYGTHCHASIRLLEFIVFFFQYNHGKL